MSRQQLPPQIKKVTVADRKTGKSVVRYQVTVDTGTSPQTGRSTAGAATVRDRTGSP